MTLNTRCLTSIHRNESYGVYVPINDAQALIELCGWEIVHDVFCGDNICLLIPPMEEREEEAA